MITRVGLKYFKLFEGEEFKLADHVVLAGPNNSGKTTLIQAIKTWHFALSKWLTARMPGGEAGGDGAINGIKRLSAKVRTGAPLTRKEFTPVPLRELNLLWTDTFTGLRRKELKGQKLGAPRVLTITLAGETDGENWELGMEFRYANSELIYTKPSAEQLEDLPIAARNLTVVHVPPFSGIGPEETGVDRPYQELLIGQGKAGEILRNLLLEVHQLADGNAWGELVAQVERIFGYRLLPPQYEGRAFIMCEYLPGIPPKRGKGGLPRLDIANAGSGFQQVLLLLGFFYARPASLLLLDEPDAHLHIVLQKEVFDHLRQVAAARKCQLIVATHSEVLLEAASPNRVVSFYGPHPHVLVSDVERDQVREALKRASALDILLAEQAQGVLYVEDETDFNLLRAWARLLGHRASRWFERSAFWHPLHGRNPGDARAHFFALQAVHKGLRGYLLLDGDDRGRPDHEVGADGLVVGRWRRYEAESYLVHPAALERFAQTRTLPLLASKGRQWLQDELPPAITRDPTGAHEFLETAPASKTLLPGFFKQAAVDLAKREYFFVVEQMRAEEVPDEVRAKLDDIATALGIQA